MKLSRNWIYWIYLRVKFAKILQLIDMNKIFLQKTNFNLNFELVQIFRLRLSNLLSSVCLELIF